jgi:hypothetical protein
MVVFEELPVEMQETILEWLDPLSMWTIGIANRTLHHLCKERLKKLKCLNGMIPPLNVLTQHVLASRELCMWMQDDDKHAGLVEYYLKETHCRTKPFDLLYMIRSGNTTLIKNHLDRNPDWCIPLYYTNAIVASIQSGKPSMLDLVYDLTASTAPLSYSLQQYRDAIAPCLRGSEFVECCHMSPFSLPRNYANQSFQSGKIHPCDIPHVGDTSGSHWSFARRFVHLTEEELSEFEETVLRNESLARKFLYWKLQDMIDRGTYRSFTKKDMIEYKKDAIENISKLGQSLLVYAAYWAPENTLVDAMLWIMSLCEGAAFVAVERIFECICATGNTTVLRTIVESNTPWAKEMRSFISCVWGWDRAALDAFGTPSERHRELVSYVKEMLNSNHGDDDEPDPGERKYATFALHLNLYSPRPKSDTNVWRSKKKKYRVSKVFTTERRAIETKQESDNQPNRTVSCCNVCEVTNGCQLTYADPYVKPRDILKHVGKTSIRSSSGDVMFWDVLDEVITMIYKGSDLDTMIETTNKIARRRISVVDSIKIVGTMLLFSREDLLDAFTKGIILGGDDKWSVPGGYSEYLLTMAVFSGNWAMVRKLASCFLIHCSRLRLTVSPLITNLKWILNHRDKSFGPPNRGHIHVDRDPDDHLTYIFEIHDPKRKSKRRKISK